MSETTPSKSQNDKDWRLRDKLCLKELADLPIQNQPIGVSKALEVPIERWGRFFQSPVNKLAVSVPTDNSSNQKPAFAFDQKGALRLDGSDVSNALRKWLEIKDGDNQLVQALQTWLKTGSSPKGELLDKFRSSFYKETMKPDQLDNQPICRLVRANQLRYDPNYLALYQLTPAECRLIESNQQTDPKKNDLDDVRRNQKIFWTLSYTLYSAIALFDSDLGRKTPKNQKIRETQTVNGNRSRETKEFLRIYTDASNNNEFITPHVLNEFSPLRYWSPATTFAESVFHMLFWQPLITGQDLYHREFPNEVVLGYKSKELLKARSEYYFVAINTFQAANYWITDYAHLFELFLILSTEISELATTDNMDRPLHDLGDLTLKENTLTRTNHLLFEHFRRDQNLSPPTNANIAIKLPFKSVFDEIRNSVASLNWELADPYKENDDSDQGTCAKDLLLMLRDRIIQLILWSKYQKEIRSVGNIPIHLLYAIELNDDRIKEIEKLLKHFDNNNKEIINNELIKAFGTGDVMEWVTLHKVYDRSQNAILDNPWIKNLEQYKVPNNDV